MIFPAIAARTFSRLKSDLYFRKIYNAAVGKLKRIKNPIKKAQYIHEQVDEKMKEVLSDELANKLIQCQKGCTSCCHTQVSVTQDEAKLLASRVKEGVSVDLRKLILQAEAGNSGEEFLKLSHDLRACVFLNEAGQCSVYEDRPSVCRTNYVISDPKLCDTSSGENSVSLLKTEEADMVVYGSFDYAKRAGALPYMLLKELRSKKSEKKSIQQDL